MNSIDSKEIVVVEKAGEANNIVIRNRNAYISKLKILEGNSNLKR